MLEYIVFEPVVDLEQTARLMSKVVGATFEKDKNGDYEEYPAYVADINDTHYALLGPPTPEDDCRHEPDHDYELIVRSRSSENFEQKIAGLIERMTAVGINCHIME